LKEEAMAGGHRAERLDIAQQLHLHFVSFPNSLPCHGSNVDPIPLATTTLW
jgi:hypothetical protein